MMKEAGSIVDYMITTFYNRNIFKFIVSAIISMVLLYAFSLWVPFSDALYYGWREGNLFKEIKPRAILGTIATILNIGDKGFAIGKLCSLWIWLTLIVWQIIRRNMSAVSPIKIYYLFCVAFIFAFSTVSQMAFGPFIFIDSIPYLLVLITYLIISTDQNLSPQDYIVAVLLLCLAVAIHEKSFFDIAILFFWLLYKKGMRKTILVIGPVFGFSSLFLFLTRNKSLTGDTLVSYIENLQRGLEFLSKSFSPKEILFGGGSLWILYVYLAFRFVISADSIKDRNYRLVLVMAMLICCFAPLLVGWDTNRLVGIIWLPTFILLTEVGSQIFVKPNFYKTLSLSFLCIFQLAMPPILRFPGALFAYNNYAKFVYGDYAKFVIPPIRKGEVVTFKDQSKGSKYLEFGWSGPEAWGVWSINKVAAIQLENIDPLVSNISIRFNAMASKSTPNQNVLIYADNQLLFQAPVDKFNDNIASFSIPKRKFHSLKLEFQLDNLYSPVEIGVSHDDFRKLGIGLVSIQFD